MSNNLVTNPPTTMRQLRSLSRLMAALTVAVGIAFPALAQTCGAPPGGLTHWWPGDNDVVDIIGGRTAILQSGATYGAGLVGQAFQLDGNNDYVEVPHDAALDAGTNPFSVDLWVRFNSTSGEQVLIEKWIEGNSGWTFTKLGSNQIQFATFGGSPTSAPQTIPTNTWIHFAARRSGTTAAVFMNGTQIASGTIGSNLASPSSIKLGRRSDGRGFFLNGRIDEAHLYVGTALSDTQIQDIHAAGAAGLCPNQACGDGSAQGEEECDDGNNVNGDGCENDCTLSCGNGTTDAGEQCDDGNAVNGDTCDSNCTLPTCGNGQLGGSEACDDGNASNLDTCKNDCTLNVCGDGSLNTGVEGCDDGAFVDGDGCDSNCTTTACGNGIATAGETCDDGNTTEEDACKNDCSANICGDGVAHTGVEACDDGNGVNGDGCDTDCSISCGNGVASAPETCDDGDLEDGDGCDSNCTVTACGNGIRAGSEACDDGNVSDLDGCKNDCSANTCGDGAVFTGQETCDDGNVLDGDGCDSDCTVSGPCAPMPLDLTAWWTADGSGADIQGGFDAAAKNGAGFGVGRSRQGFLLDGVDDFFGAPHDVALDVASGDFTVDLWVNFDSTAGEQVLIEKWVQAFGGGDAGWTLTKLSNNSIRLATTAGNTDSKRLDLPTNTWIHVAARRTAGVLAILVNGVVVAEDEAPGDLSNDSSIKFGHRGGPLDTPGSLDTRGFFLDGRLDEIHFINGRALADAEIEAIHAAGRSGLCIPVPVCGNALVEAGEACDDGNGVDGDGCDTNCSLSCGNGTTDAGEGCDDANSTNGDGCDNNCTVSTCGNGIPAGTEECDDANATSGDGCDENCTATACGNGVATDENGESCDDGNAIDGDGCETDCRITPVEEVADPNETITTDPLGLGATPAQPVQVALTTPEGGVISIATSEQPLASTNVLGLILGLLIEAPPASAAVPLRIAIRIDASSLIPGTPYSSLALVRNGVVLPDCLGPNPVAVPDPCMYARNPLPDGDIELVALTSHASEWSAGVRGLFDDERKCVSDTAKAGAAVIKQQDKTSGVCLKDGLAGAELNAQACLLADGDGKVAGKKQKTLAVVAARCPTSPPIAFVDAATTNSAAQDASLALVADLFGNDLTSALAGDADGGKCQTAVLKDVQKLFGLNSQLFRNCMADGLAGEPTLMATGQQLATCFDNLAVDSKLLKGVSKLGKTILRKCGSSTPTLLPGVCSGARNVAYCLKNRVACRTCQLFNTSLGLSADCDLVDDRNTNASCD